MRVTMLAPSTRHPVEGVTALYGFANALRPRAHDVLVAHVDFIGWQGSRMSPDKPAERVRRLIHDDAKRVRLATAGRAYVQRFDWEESGRRPEALLSDYAADPSRI